MSYISQSIVLAEFTSKSKKEITQGIIFRDNNKFGLIIPKRKWLENERCINLTINAPGMYIQEVEFTIEIDKIYIHSNDFLSYIPLKDLSMNGFKLDYTSSAYSREVLNCVKYCMIRDIFTGNVSYPSTEPPIISSFLLGIAESLVCTKFYNYMWHESNLYHTFYDYINIMDIELFDGCPLICNGSHIAGIIISNPIFKDIKNYKNTGIIVNSNCILDLLNGI